MWPGHVIPILSYLISHSIFRSLCLIHPRIVLVLPISLVILFFGLGGFITTPYPFPINFLYLIGQPWACSKCSRVLKRYFGHWSDCSQACLHHWYHASLLPTLLISLLNLSLLSLLFPVHIFQVLLLSFTFQWLSVYPCLVLLYLDCQSGLMHNLWWCSYYKPGVSYQVTLLLRKILLRSSLFLRALLEKSLFYRYNMQPSRKCYEVLIVVIVATTPLLG